MSKKMNASAFSCADRSVIAQPPGYGTAELEVEPDDTCMSENTTLPAKLILCHAFTPKVPVDYAGPSYFGGKDDELVLCVSKGIPSH